MRKMWKLFEFCSCYFDESVGSSLCDLYYVLFSTRLPLYSTSGYRLHIISLGYIILWTIHKLYRGRKFESAFTMTYFVYTHIIIRPYYYIHIIYYTIRSEKCINIIQLGEFSLWMMAQVVNKNLTCTPPIRCYRDNKSTWPVSLGRIHWRLVLMCSRFTINFPFVTFALPNRPRTLKLDRPINYT